MSLSRTPPGARVCANVPSACRVKIAPPAVVNQKRVGDWYTMLVMLSAVPLGITVQVPAHARCVAVSPTATHDIVITRANLIVRMGTKSPRLVAPLDRPRRWRQNFAPHQGGVRQISQCLILAVRFCVLGLSSELPWKRMVIESFFALPTLLLAIEMVFEKAHVLPSFALRAVNSVRPFLIVSRTVPVQAVLVLRPPAP